MSDYTPTDGEILTAVVLYRAIASADAPPPTIDSIATPEETARYLGEYQRWLAEHDAKVRSESYQRILDAANVDERSSVILAVVKGIARDGIREASDADRIERGAGLK